MSYRDQSVLSSNSNNNTYENYNNEDLSTKMYEQVLMLRKKLENLKEKKKLLENEDDNLNLKLNDLKQIIKRISNDKI